MTSLPPQPASPTRDDWRIRLALPDDAVALGTIQAASHLTAYKGIIPDSILGKLTANHLADRFRSRLAPTAVEAPSQHRLWVIEADGVVAGYAATQPGASTFLPPPDGAGEMESLYLRPGAQGRGLGVALHCHAIGDLVARGFDPLVLWAFAANGPARRFYERAGWTVDVTGENWLLGGVACPIVRYRLGQPQVRGAIQPVDTRLAASGS
jgi:ribosomal protein S18 acetylase RimI-like enzyme